MLPFWLRCVTVVVSPCYHFDQCAMDDFVSVAVLVNWQLCVAVLVVAVLYECQSKRRQTETSTEKNAGPKSKRRQLNFKFNYLNQNVDKLLQC